MSQASHRGHGMSKMFHWPHDLYFRLDWSRWGCHHRRGLDCVSSAEYGWVSDCRDGLCQHLQKRCRENMLGVDVSLGFLVVVLGWSWFGFSMPTHLQLWTIGRVIHSLGLNMDGRKWVLVMGR